MSTSGPNSPGTAADSNVVGGLTWSNATTGCIAAGGTASTVSSTGIYLQSHYLKATNFGFSIPSGATINGIYVEIYKKKAGAVPLGLDVLVNIIKSDGSIGGTNRADTSTQWPTSYSYIGYGSTSDLWGESWGYGDINDADFGVAISAKVGKSGGKGGATIYIDHIRITITYTEGATSSIKAVGTVAQASIGKVSGQTSANIKKIGGVANQ